MPFLRILAGDEPKVFQVGEVELIGREAGCTIRLSDPRVSRQHARIERTPDGRYEIVDLGSSHGTVLAGRPIQRAVLADGEEIRLGSVRLRFESGEELEGPQVLHRLNVTPQMRFRPAREISDLDELRADYEKLRVAHEFGRSIGSEGQLGPLLDRILESAFGLLRAERGVIVLLDPVTGEIRAQRSRSAAGEALAVPQAILKEVVSRRTGVVATDAGLDSRFQRSRSVLSQGIRSMMCVPLADASEVLGVLYLDSLAAAGAFEERDLELLAAIGSQASLAIRNVALREQIEQASLAERRRLDQLVRDLPIGVLLLDASRRIVLANPAALRLLPLLTDSHIGDPLTRLGPFSLEQISQRGGSGCVEIAVDGPPARFFVVSVACSGPGTEAVVLVREVTEEREREQQEARSERMALVGQLAGGIAHDFNNLLSVILSYTEILAGELEGTPHADDVDFIRQASQRAAALTRQLLTFSRREIVKPLVFDLNRVVAGMEMLLRRTIGENIELVLSLEPGLWRVRADPGRIEQVIVNLAVNARDAMPQGGKLVIATHNERLADDRTHTREELPAGRYVSLSVSDTGHGMPAEVAARVFEPFFTTKEVGRGTGLGLATVHGIVKQAGGNIWVDTAPGQGATFHVWLPATDEPPAAQDRPALAPATARGGEVILLAEDEPAVRRVASRILRQGGYGVLEAGSAEEALREAERAGTRIDLLLTDVVMPGTSGRDLATCLRASRPELPVVFMTGYTDVSERYGALGEDATIVQKPFTPKSLLAVVQEALSGKREPSA